MYERILVPTDGSEGTARVVDHAVEIARGRDAEIHVLSVADRRLFLSADADEQDDVIEALHEEASAAVEDAVALIEAADDGDHAVVTEVREGVPHTEILRYAEDADVDLLAIGTHGRTGREKLVNLGSVTDRVVKSADCPVLVVRIGTGDGDDDA